MDKFKYQVDPKIPIKGLPAHPQIIRRALDLFLNKDDVKFCLKYGPVYRKFDGSNIVKVTLFNLDRLHREELIEEEDFGTLAAPVIEKEVVIEPKKPSLVVEPKKVDEPIVIIPKKVTDNEENNKLLEDEDGFAEDDKDVIPVAENSKAQDENASEKEVTFEDVELEENPDEVG